VAGTESCAGMEKSQILRMSVDKAIDSAVALVDRFGVRCEKLVDRVKRMIRAAAKEHLRKAYA